VTWLIAETGQATAAAYYVIFGAAVGVVATAMLPSAPAHAR